MKVAAAIADDVRREILEVLADGPRPAGLIAERFDISRPAVSRHLRVLRESELVVAERVGRRIVYRLDLAPLIPLITWLARLENRWPQRLDALATEVHRTRRERRASTAHEETA